MRRSAAPSQKSAGIKRIKFTAPASVVRGNESQFDDDESRQDNLKLPRTSSANNYNNPVPTKKIAFTPVLTTSNTNRVIPKRDLSRIISLTKPQTDHVDNDAPSLHHDHDDNTEEDFSIKEQNTRLNENLISATSLPKCNLTKSAVKNRDGSPEQRCPLDDLEVNNGVLPSVLDCAQTTPNSNNLNDDVTTVASREETGARYFSVMWCKLSKKKHKKWEGDAILTTKGRSATLYDMEGKVIGRGTGYKIAQLENLGEDDTLAIGGKEIQVMSLLKEEQFRSGKCFSSAASSTDSSSQSVTKSSAFKAFVNPVKHGGGKLPCQAVLQPDTGVLGPRHDPTAPNALVMPRPSTDHQWRYNKSGLSLVDVVVDPFLVHFLRTHQRHGIVFLYECIMEMRDFEGQGAILADDMGLGKTLQCITLIWTLLKQGPYGGKPIAKKVLIVTPGSLVMNWYMEFKKWLGLERLNVFAVSGDKKVDEFVKSVIHPVLVISYEMMVRCFETLKNVKFDLIVCDEGHRLKNTSIKTSSMLASLPTRKRIVLTGTPVQNDLQEFYSIVEFCNPGVLGTSGAFKRVYEDPIVLSRQPKATDVQKELGKDRAEELTRLTQMFVLRRTQEINNQYLPPKIELVLFCRPSKLQLDLYRQLICSQIIRRCLTGNLSGAPHLICIGALKEVCNHPSLVYRKALSAEMNKEQNCNDEEDSIYSGLLPLFPTTFGNDSILQEDSGKLEVLSGILTSIWQFSTQEKVVLVANHTKTLDVLQMFCEGKGYKCLRLDGQTPTSQRQPLVNQFNSRHCTTHRIFLLSSKAGGVGLNLVGASRLILYDIDWNPANDLQAMARVWRDGQKGKVHIYRLLTTGTIEEKIYQRQISKQGLSGAVMDLHNKNNVQFSVDDLKDLFTLNNKTDCETHTLLSCECKGDPNFSAPVPQVTTKEDDRPCQLGQLSVINKTTKGKAKNLTMAELLQWKHRLGKFAGGGDTWLLNRVGSVLSFLFWHEINSQNLSS